MESKSFNLLSEDYDDIDYIELFGSEYLSLDSEYQREASLQKLEKVESPMATRKAQAKYEREIAAKLTKYSLEPTYAIPASVRATPIHIAKPETAVNKLNSPTSSTSVISKTAGTDKQKTLSETAGESEMLLSNTASTGEEPPTLTSNNRRRKEQYKENRKRIRQQRKMKQ